MIAGIYLLLGWYITIVALSKYAEPTCVGWHYSKPLLFSIVFVGVSMMLAPFWPGLVLMGKYE